MAAPKDPASFLRSLLDRVEGLVAAVVADRDGVIIVQETVVSSTENPIVPDHFLTPSFLATTTVAAEQSGKIADFGRCRRVVVRYETHQVAHFSCPPVFVTLIGVATANTGQMLDLSDTISEAMESLLLRLPSSIIS